MGMRSSPLYLLLVILMLCSPAAALDASTTTVPLENLNVLAILDSLNNTSEDIIPDLKKYPEFDGLFKHPVQGVNRTFFFRKGDHAILVDSGWGEEQNVKGATLKALADAGIAPESVSDVLITHLDWDHIGGLTKDGKAVFPNATLWISKPEYDAWINGDLEKRPEHAKTRAKNLAAIYKGKIHQFDFGEEILPGVRALDASGHTPGHTAYQITAGSSKMDIGGDVMHLPQVQLIHPELSSKYDIDPRKAAATRERLLQQAADDNAILAGMHIPMISDVKKRPDGGYMMREPR